MKDKLYKLMNWAEIEGIIYSEEDNPHRLLGPHTVGNNTLFQTFQPGADKVKLNCINLDKTYEMEMADEEGYFAVLVPGKQKMEYSYLVKDAEGFVREVQDPYQYEPIITKGDTDKFNAGIHYRAYDILGAHLIRVDGTEGVHFAVWAPGALRVSVVGDFNHWDGRVHQMRRLWDSGIFEIFIPGVKEGENYKFELKLKSGLTYLKADPYAFGQQLRPETASVIRSLENFEWEDSVWMSDRKKKQAPDQPMSVYELHMGSFRKPEDGGFYTYTQLAPMIIEYIKKMGYTHVELMPVMEHPFDASWGYQVIGYYAPTARYGTPKEFMFFVNELHKAGIGVILDWVPAHFPRDTYGLSNFDGTCLYEHQDPRQGCHPHWGTLIYNYGRPEVSNYLIANALYWVEKYHVDGIRMDAVASMLYLDYGKNDGEWVANIYGGNENLEAVEFLKHLNSMLHKLGKGAISIAEESTAWPRITGDLKEDGLGFDYKWNMGWMNDYLEYIKYDPFFRAHHHGELTFSMIYAYSEKFMLVFSHDEVVHGKGTLIGKMPGESKEQFANLRVTLAYMMMHPGKKLLFMGQDLGEYQEWSEEREVNWQLLEQEDHKKLNHFMAELNHFYRKHPALYELDCKSEGFEWINSIAYEECMLTFLRKTKKTEDTLLIAVNFANVERRDYTIGVPVPGRYKEILNSDAQEFGGGGITNPRVKMSSEEACDNRKDSIKINMAGLSISIFTCEPYSKEELAEIEKIKEEAKKKIEAVKKSSRSKSNKKKTSLKEELAQKIAAAEKEIASGSELKRR